MIRPAVIRRALQEHVGIVQSLIEEDPVSYGSLLGESFEVGQLAHASNTAGAVSKMAARFSSGSDELGRLVRAREDIVERRRLLDQRMLDAISGPASDEARRATAETRTNLAALERRLEELDITLGRDFPDYAELTNPQPLELFAVMRLLKQDEALLAYVLGPDNSFLWVLRSNRATLHRLPVTQSNVEDDVALLRGGLVPGSLSDLSEIPEYDLALAHRLYRDIFAPAEPFLTGARHVIVVPDLALTSLPFGVLVTAEPSQERADFSAYRDAPWLARSYAISVLPSVGSLSALRRFAQANRAPEAFIGFGDPNLDGPTGGARGIDIKQLFVRASMADVEAVRALPPLPETALELAEIAESLGAGADNLYLQDEATEPMVRDLRLADYRVIAFATHGLMAGDFDALAEPALVLTPPSEARADDDGLLTAGEIARLRLNADWVILSACNTAASDGTPGAAGLSGLTKAFFYAGSRSLLVSHWAVVSDAAVMLTTGMFAALADRPDIGRAEALQHAMLALVNDEERPSFSHPMFWAPFSIVGEGGNLGQVSIGEL